MSVLIECNTHIRGGASSSSVWKGNFQGRPVAVKRVALAISEKNEDKAMIELNHPNIVKVLHRETDNGFRKYSMELCDASLDQLFLNSDDPQKYKGPMPRRIEILIQLASGLEHIHSKNLIYRNIRPNNVLIKVRTSLTNEQVTFKWADFGLSETVNEWGIRSPRKIKRSKNWLAPELLNLLSQGQETINRQATNKSDVFAQALVFGSLFLNGQHLYGSMDEENEIVHNIMNGNPINMQNIDEKLRQLYENDLLLKMLEYDPDNRMTSTQVVTQLKFIKTKVTGKEEELRQLCAAHPQLDVTEIKNLIRFGIDVNAKDGNGWNALHHLCRNYSGSNLIDAIQVLIKHGIDVKAKTNDGSNAVHCLSRYNSSSNVMDAIQLLLESGIEVNAKNNEGSTMLYYLGVKNKQQMKIWIDHEALLGSDALCHVFKGKFGGLEVAVKRISIKDCNAKDEAMLKLDHPNIVKLFHCEKDHEFKYYATELCVASLDQLFLDSNDPKKYNGVMPRHIEVFLQLASGLKHIHSNGLVYGDIKPENILISEMKTGETVAITMKWADFGLSDPVNEQETLRSRGIKQTQKWFAPEILRHLNEGKECPGTYKSDVFAQGLVFGCLLLNGQHLYGTDENEIRNNILGKMPINMKNKDCKLSDRYERVLLKMMLEDDPSNRITSAQVVDELTSIMNEFTEKEEKLRELCGSSDSDPKEEIENLILSGIDVNAKDNEGRNALHYLCRNNSILNLIGSIDILRKSGIDMNAKTIFGGNALHLLCHYNSSTNLPDAIHCLIQWGIDVNSKARYGNNALHLLCQFNSNENLIRAIETVIEQGIDVNAKNNEEWNALHVLCKFNSNANLIGAVNILIERGIDVHAKTKDRGWNALHILCHFQSGPHLIDAIKILIQSGINVNLKASDKRNALHYLCQSNSSPTLIEAVEFLIQSGIDVGAKKRDGWNALHILCEFNSNSNLLKILQILIEKGLNLHEKTESGKNAIDFLVNKKEAKDLKSNIFRFLIRHGVQMNGNYKANHQEYQDFLKENDNCGKICFDLLVEEGISFGWHPSCEHCKQILSIKKNARLGLQHHQMFSNCYLVFHFLVDDLEKWVTSTAKFVDSQMDMKDATKLLLQLAEQYQPSNANEKSYKEDFELMAEVGEQVKNGNDSSQFNCDNYERYLRSMYSIAEMTNSKESIEEIQWFYLLPFDFPVDYGNEKESDTKREKIEWDKTLYSWAHKITDRDYGKFMKEDANEGFFLPKEFKHNCHNGQSFKPNSIRSVELANKEKEEELRQLCARDSLLDLTEKMEHLIDFGIDVNAKDGKGRNALHRLCRNNSSSNLTDAIQKLIQSGIDVNARDKGEHNALHILCEKNSSPKLSDSIKMLIESGMDLDATDNNGRNALHILCLNNQSSNLKDAIQMLVQCGIDVDAKDYAGRNASDYLPAYLSDAIQIIKNATSSQTTKRKDEEPQPDGVGKKRRAN